MRLAAAALCLLLSACRTTPWDQASARDTAQGYREFLARHPTDEYVDAARARLAALELDAARQAHTVVAYKRWLDEFGDDERSPQARALLEGLRFNAAREKGTVGAWRQFLKDHPDGSHRAEADQALARAELLELGLVQDPARLRELAQRYPDDPRAERAGAVLDDRAWSEAKGAADAYAYLRANPAGAHRDDARARLLALQVDALLASGLLEEARALSARAPLASRVPDLQARLEREEQYRRVTRSKSPAVQRALAAWYLRDFDELLKAFHAPDPMDRWQAVEELGHHVTIRSIDPLLEVLRTSRVTLARLRAFEALARVLRALPPNVVEYEVATRREAAREATGDDRLWLSQAVLTDLGGDPDRAVADYRRAFDANLPDPLVLRRWAEVSRAQGRLHSAAVAARQLGTWALEVARSEPVSKETALKASRELCAAQELTRLAAEVAGAAKATGTEFPEDVAEIERRVREARALVDARLRDAELLLLEADPRARRCGDQAVTERLAAAEAQRTEALRGLPKPDAAAVRALVRERDPSPRVRAAAADAPPPGRGT